ncbi:MAG: tetratricopeptide repeat protein, partial [Candidatus Thorarchaeota archaeon]
RTDQWDRLTRLSFVKDRSDQTWVLHDLARELIVAELDQRLQASTDEVAELLEKASAAESDYTLLGLAISVQALASEKDAEARVGSIVSDLSWNYIYSDALVFLDAVAIDTREGHAIVQGLRGGVLIWLNRVADGEDAFLNALEAYPGFGEEIPDELMVHKARTLRDYGGLLWRTQRISEAIETLQKSVSIYRKLDEKTLGFRIDTMARALLWLGSNLISVNRLEEGEKTCREAYELFQRSKQTASYHPARGIIPSLRLVSLALLLAGKVQESEQILQEGLEVCKELAKERPEIEYSVAMYSQNLGELMSSTSRPHEAVDLLREALHLTREATKKESEKFSLDLIFGLNNLALPLGQIGRYAEAEEKYQEALAMSRELAEKTPNVFLTYLAWTLFDYAVLLRQTDRASEAEEACREALSIHRELVADSPDKHLSRLAWNLNNLAVLLWQTGRVTEAEENYQEALEIAREIAPRAPEAVFMTDLLTSILNNLGVLLRQTDRTSEAEEAILEALDLRRQLAQKSPELFLHRVATTLNNLGILLFEKGRASEAEDALGEALQLRRELIGESPDLYQPSVGSTLNNLGILLKRTGRTSEAENVYREAIDNGEELVSKAPMVYQRELVRTLCNYALLLSAIDSADTLQKTMTRLAELGVESLPENEEWSEETEDVANPQDVL